MASILRSIGIKKPKHKKLSRELSPESESVVDFPIVEVEEGAVGGGTDFTFQCKYLGCTPIEQSSNVKLMTSAIRQIIEMSKAKGKKLPNITLEISAKGISARILSTRSQKSMGDGQIHSRCKKHGSSCPSIDQAKTVRAKSVIESTVKGVNDNNNREGNLKPQSKGSQGRELSVSGVTVPKDRRSLSLNGFNRDGDDLSCLFNISIYRISYCSADSTYDRAVAFVATNRNGSHECHAFFTEKHKVAQSIALSISHAFNQAFLQWQQRNREQLNSDGEVSPPGTSSVSSSSDDQDFRSTTASGSNSPASSSGSDTGEGSSTGGATPQFNMAVSGPVFGGGVYFDKKQHSHFSNWNAWNNYYQLPTSNNNVDTKQQQRHLAVTDSQHGNIDIKQLLNPLPCGSKKSSNRQHSSNSGGNASMLINFEPEESSSAPKICPPTPTHIPYLLNQDLQDLFQPKQKPQSHEVSFGKNFYSISQNNPFN